MVTHSHPSAIRKDGSFESLELIKPEKIATAKRPLRDPRMTIGEIAERCGYELQSNFFRRETRISPRAWRQANQ